MIIDLTAPGMKAWLWNQLCEDCESANQCAGIDCPGVKPSLRTLPPSAIITKTKKREKTTK